MLRCRESPHISMRSPILSSPLRAIDVPRPLRWLDAFADWWFGRQVWWYALVAAIYIALAVAFTYPLIRVLGTHVPYKPSGDQLFQLSILEWERQTLFARPGDLFSGNFYFGSGNPLFASDLLLGILPVYAPLAWISNEPLLAYNLTHIAAYALNAWVAYALALAITHMDALHSPLNVAREMPSKAARG